jgi:4-hydroxythreonine-4-phosphate dehydrogenase
VVPVIDTGTADPRVIRQGVVSAEAGKAAGEDLKRAVGLAMAGEVDGVTYASLNKGALNLGGWHYPDDLHLFCALTGYDGPCGELNVLDALWTSRVTSHVPLREVAAHLTPEAIDMAIRLIHSALTDAGLERPRIAVAALNPHAGDGGLCGDEELTLIAPAVERARAAGIHCEGPYASDTIFLRARDGRCDAVVTMYHDQGQVATKLMGFGRGVTVCAGLPVVLTTPAHGTAHDIVGTGKATPTALENAIRLAGRMASRRQLARA